MTQQEVLNNLKPCPICEKEIWVNALHCPGCGWQQSLEGVISHSKSIESKDLEPCPVCAAEIWVGAKSCPQCSWTRKSLLDRRRQSTSSISAKTFYSYIFEAKEGRMSLYEQFAMYLGLVVGVIFSSHLRGTQETTTWVFAAVTALVISPVAFEKLKLAPDSPFFVKFGLFVQNGVFWDILFEAIGSKLS